MFDTHLWAPDPKILPVGWGLQTSSESLWGQSMRPIRLRITEKGASALPQIKAWWDQPRRSRQKAHLQSF